jgi:dTDP-4-dehydrorhamnose reductase
MKINGNNIKVLITGGKGQLGTDLTDVLKSHNFIVHSFGSKDVDISNLDNFFKIAKNINPHIIINCGAYTKVDNCEEDVDTAFKINAIGAKNCAIVSDSLKCKLIHISTDYVFNGEKDTPYTEYDAPQPVSVYGKSKYFGEVLIKEHCNRYFILRVAGVYGEHGNNFVKTIINLSKKNKSLKVVNDQKTTPTSTIAICNQILNILLTDNFGTYHSTCEGECSWYEFTKEIFNILNIDTEVIPCTTEEFPRPAKRPQYSVLENYNLKLLGINKMIHWKDALKEFLRGKKW